MSLQRMGKYRYSGKNIPSDFQEQTQFFLGLENAKRFMKASQTLWKHKRKSNWNEELRAFVVPNHASVHEPYLIAMGIMKGVYCNEVARFDFEDRWEEDKPKIREHMRDYVYSKRLQFIQDYYKPSVIQGTPKRIRDCV